MAGEMKQELTCPLGSKCVQFVDRNGEQIEQRCMWHTKLAGKDPQSERIVDEWSCAIAWLPVLLVENAQTNRGQTAALESFRNEVTRQIGGFLQLAQVASRIKLEDKQ